MRLSFLSSLLISPREAIDTGLDLFLDPLASRLELLAEILLKGFSLLDRRVLAQFLLESLDALVRVCAEFFTSIFESLLDLLDFIFDGLEGRLDSIEAVLEQSGLLGHDMFPFFPRPHPAKRGAKLVSLGIETGL